MQTNHEHSYLKRLAANAWNATVSRTGLTVLGITISVIATIFTVNEIKSVLNYAIVLVASFFSVFIVQFILAPARLDRELRQENTELKRRIEELARDVAIIQARVPEQNTFVWWEPDHIFAIQTKRVSSEGEGNIEPLLSVKLVNYM